MEYSRVWEKELDLSPYQIYFYETMYKDVIPRTRDARNMTEDMAYLLRQIESLRLSRKATISRIKDSENQAFEESLLENLFLDDSKGSKKKKGRESSSPYRPVDPEYAYKMCKKRVLDTMLTSHVVHDRDMKILFEACMSLEEEILGPYGMYPTVYVRERLIQDFAVQ